MRMGCCIRTPSLPASTLEVLPGSKFKTGRKDYKKLLESEQSADPVKYDELGPVDEVEEEISQKSKDYTKLLEREQPADPVKYDELGPVDEVEEEISQKSKDYTKLLEREQPADPVKYDELGPVDEVEEEMSQKVYTVSDRIKKFARLKKGDEVGENRVKLLVDMMEELARQCGKQGGMSMEELARQRGIRGDTVGEENHRQNRMLTDSMNVLLQKRPKKPPVPEKKKYLKGHRLMVHDSDRHHSTVTSDRHCSSVTSDRHRSAVTSDRHCPDFTSGSIVTNSTTRTMTRCEEGLSLTKQIRIKTESSGVTGITWLGDQIFVVCRESRRVHVFQDGNPYSELEGCAIELDGLEYPQDMVSSLVGRAIFISESDKERIWKVEMPGREVSRREIDGELRGLSATPSGDLLMVVEKWHGPIYLDIHRSLDIEKVTSVALPADVRGVMHAVQASNGNFIVTYDRKESRGVYLVGELALVSVDGKNFIRTFDFRCSIFGSAMQSWHPHYVFIDSSDNILMADTRGDRVYVLNSRLTDLRIVLNGDRHQINFPQRIYYRADRQQLIVGHGAMMGSAALVAIFNTRSFI